MTFFFVDVCTSGEGNDPESLLKVLLDEQGVTGIAREPIDHYIISVSKNPLYFYNTFA